MRSQASEWAASVSPEMKQDPGAQGVFRLESSTPGGAKVSRRETGGVGGSWHAQRGWPGNLGGP